MAGSSWAVGTRMLWGRVDAQPEHGWGVQVREEDQDVIGGVVSLEVLEEGGTPGSLLFEPLHLVVGRVGVMEDPI